MRHGGAGLGLALLSATTFGSSGTFATALIGAGWTPGGAVLVRVAVAAVLLTVPAVLALRGRWGELRRRAARMVVFGVLAVGIAQLCFFYAVGRIPVGVALLLEYSGTLLVVVWMWLRRGQRPGRVTVSGAALSIAGLALVLDLVSGVGRLDPIGVLWGLGAAVGLAAYFVLSADTDDAVPPLAVAWSGLTVGAVALAALAAVHALPVATPAVDVTLAGHRVSWLVPVAGLAVVAGAVAYITGIVAARLLGARLASFVGLAEVLAAVGFAWLLLGQRPTAVQAVGGVLVVLGVGVVRAGEAVPAGEAVTASRAPRPTAPATPAVPTRRTVRR